MCVCVCVCVCVCNVQYVCACVFYSLECLCATVYVFTYSAKMQKASYIYSFGLLSKLVVRAWRQKDIQLAIKLSG